jgi:predicted nuclease of restriction endonuclease-like (RecB) superfamily
MALTYFEIERIIVEHEQKGKEKALYGKETLKKLSHNLIHEFGKGFSVTNLKQLRTFYLTYRKGQTVSGLFPKQQILSTKSQKSETLSRKFTLSWSHYIFLMRLNEAERNFYEIESTQNSWSLSELERQFNSGLYERLSLSKNKDDVKALSQKGHIVTQPHEAIKDPYILEFLGLKGNASYSESDLEQAIIDKIEHFLLELGKGFTFVGRQQRFTFEEEHFFVDLVFYNRLLKSFVLIDLKIGKLKHQDLGQIQMYVNYYDRFVKTEEENNTIGIILCKDKKDSLVEITLPKDNNQIFASKYKLYLPTKEELKKQLLDVKL